MRNWSIIFVHHVCIYEAVFCYLRFGAAWLYYGIVLLTTQFLQHDPHCGYGIIIMLCYKYCKITYIHCAVLNESNMTCEVLTRDDYISILWTGVAEVPGNV